MSRGARISHFHGENHASRYRRVQQLEQEVNRREQMRELEPRVKQLGLEIWRNDVKSKMYEYLCNDTSRMIMRDLFGNLITSRPAAHLARYECKEILSLLELALWKSSALNGDMFDTIQEIREYPVLDEEFDVRRYFDEARVLSGCSSIIPRVLAFL